MKLVVVDLDGTLCDDTHRKTYARNKEWEQYNALLHLDKPRRDVERFVRMCRAQELTTLALTARSAVYRPQTLLWLLQHDLRFDDLVMREEHDWRPGVEVKPDLLQSYLAKREWTGDDVLCILEDHDGLVETWRNAGFACWQVAPSR